MDDCKCTVLDSMYVHWVGGWTVDFFLFGIYDPLSNGAFNSEARFEYLG